MEGLRRALHIRNDIDEKTLANKPHHSAHGSNTVARFKQSPGLARMHVS
jgi:hypothetical protein